MNSKKIGDRLVKLRQDRKLTVAEAAIDLGITPSALSNYENGIRIPRDSIKIKIADYYNESITAIFFDD